MTTFYDSRSSIEAAAPLSGADVRAGSADARASSGALLDALDRSASRYAERVAFRSRSASGGTEITYAGLRAEARRGASWMMESGITRGASVAILSESRPEWGIALLATMMAGATAVPLDAKLTAGELSFLLAHSEPRMIFVSRAMEPVARKAMERARSVELLVVLDGDSTSAGPTLATMIPRRSRQPRRRDDDETALVVYTSGTTGEAKGVQTTFGNLHFEARAIDLMIGPMGTESFLSVLPTTHLFELICGFFTPLLRGASITYSESLLPDDIAALMRDEGITTMVGVPLLFRALKRGIERRVRERGPATEKRFARAMKLARFLPMRAMRRLLFREVLASFGPRLRLFSCGGAALDIEVARFFESLGIATYQGYGLTETSPVITSNRPGAQRLGSVGLPLDGVEIRIREGGEEGDGEIETRGPHVMAGYLRRDDLTRQVIDADGWLRTGDLGRIDEAGFLYVTGRSKDLVVLGGGKKVHPDEVEEVLAKSALLDEVCVLGVPGASAMAKGFDEVCAVVVPGAELRQGAGGDDARVEEAVRAEIARLAEAVAPFKRPTRIVVSAEALPKTATRKLKRAAIRRSLAAPATNGSWNVGGEEKRS